MQGRLKRRKKQEPTPIDPITRKVIGGVPNRLRKKVTLAHDRKDFSGHKDADTNRRKNNLKKTRRALRKMRKQTKKLMKRAAHAN